MRHLGIALVGLLLALGCASCAIETPTRAPGVTEWHDIAPNPAGLGMYSYAPPGLRPGAPLIVALHHCFQRAQDYAIEAGWLQLADRYGFAVLMPEQTASNDLDYCFDWSSAWQRDPKASEPVSIRTMIDAVVRRYDLDPRRVYATGLSAGGSMALILMALYPDLIAGGGVFGSLPVGQASVFIDAPIALLGIGSSDPQSLAQRVREATGTTRADWPILSVWHGTDDGLVAPSNGARIRDQWRALWGLESAAPAIDRVGPYRRERWSIGGKVVVEYVVLDHIGHSVVIDSAGGCGRAPRGWGDLVSDVGLCSSLELLRFWGIVQAPAAE